MDEQTVTKALQTIVPQTSTVASGANEPQKPQKKPPLKVDWGFKTCGDPELVAMLASAVAYAELLHAQRKALGRWLALLGSSGGGKTHLARVLFDQVWSVPMCRPDLPRHSDGGRWVHWPSFMSKLKSGDCNIYELTVELGRAPFVVVDEFGGERDPSGFSAEQFCLVLEKRLGKPMVITSNLFASHIASIDARIISRMIRNGSEVVEIKTKDYNRR